MECLFRTDQMAKGLSIIVMEQFGKPNGSKEH